MAGAFAGYDRLEILQAMTLTEGVITFTARLVRAGAGLHVVELVATHRMLEVSDESGPVIKELVRGCGSSLEIWTSGMPVALGTFDGYESETRNAALVPELMMQFAEMRTENGGLPLHDLGYAD